jgi:hypothetical protein
MMAKKPVGIFHLLDDESNFPKASDLSFLEKCHYNHALNELYSRPRMSSMEFGIKHYAGQVNNFFTNSCLFVCVYLSQCLPVTLIITRIYIRISTCICISICLIVLFLSIFLSCIGRPVLLSLEVVESYSISVNFSRSNGQTSHLFSRTFYYLGLVQCRRLLGQESGHSTLRCHGAAHRKQSKTNSIFIFIPKNKKSIIFSIA